jgi:D-apionolactonase
MATKKPSRAIKLFGTEASDGKRRELAAGPITAMFDNGALRYIRYRAVEVLRGIAYLLRDKNWGTYAPAIENLKIKQGKTGFSISYDATCSDAEQSLRYQAKIEAKADGTLKFSAVGTPLSDFLTNRSGFVILHPLEGVVGKPVEVVHVDGKREKRNFPKIISPGQPIFEIRSLKHTVVPGVTATVLMEGNKFEMEDHRNWMDASYKTYVCSLLDPWPYTLKKGEAFTQSVTLTIAGKPTAKTSSKLGGAIPVTLGKTKGRMPSIGVGVPMAEAQHAVDKADLIAAAKPGQLVFQIDGRRKNQTEAAAAFRALKERTGIPATLEIVLPAKAAATEEVDAIAGALRTAGFKPDAVVITQMHDLKSFQPTAPRPWGPSYEEMAAAARKAFPGVALGGGMLSYFTELNRKPAPKGVFDFITHTACPIVHSADDLSVMETLESLPWIIDSTRAMIGTSPYHMGPTSIPCRDNPYGAQEAANPHNGRVCLSDMDPRQRGLFAAAWNLGLVAAAAKGKLDSVSLGAVTGPQGLVYRKASYVQPGFDGGDAAVYPVYHILAGLGRASGAKFIETENGAPGKIATLAYETKTGPILWLANLTGEKQTAKVSGFKGAAQIHILDEKTFDTLVKRPDYLTKAGTKVKKVSSLELGPYAVIRVAAA